MRIKRWLAVSSVACSLSFTASVVADTWRPSVNIAHIEQWGAGTFEDPIIVNRDNPEFEGAFPWYEGFSAWADGEWSDRFRWRGPDADETGPGMGTIGLIREYMWNGTFVEDQTIDFTRPEPGNQSFEQLKWANWHARNGVLVHENVYEMFDLRCFGSPDSCEQSESPLFVKLSDNINIVPVFIVYWYPPGSNGDYRQFLSALFDFMPIWSAPLPWMGTSVTITPTHFSSPAPDADEEPPDEVFWQPASGCDCLQFQIVGAVKIPWQRPSKPKCNTNEYVYEFTSDNDNGEEFWHLLDDALCPDSTSGCPEAHRMRYELKPIFVHYGNLTSCSEFAGKAEPGSPAYVHVDSAANRDRRLTSHELGHVLIDVSHCPATGLCGADSNNLMHASVGSTLTPQQCQRACANATWYSRRYREYNRKIGKTPAPESHASVGSLPGSTTELENVCCKDPETQEHFVTTPALCSYAGGFAVGVTACQQCCRIPQSPPHAAYTSECEPADVLPATKCKAVCCDSPNSAPVSLYTCEQTGGTVYQCQPG